MLLLAYYRKPTQLRAATLFNCELLSSLNRFISVVIMYNYAEWCHNFDGYALAFQRRAPCPILCEFMSDF
jgi:hypothetical protein